MKFTKIKEHLLDIHYKFYTLLECNVEQKDELEWVFLDKIQDETFVYKGIEVWVDDASLTDDEVVIMSVSGQVLEDGESLISLNVEEFILTCL